MMDTEAISHLTSQEQEEYLQSSLRIIQELSDQTTKQVEEVETQKEFKCIDLFSVRVLSLLVCRGHHREKAEFLAKLVTRGVKKEEGQQEVMISWDNERMQRAVKILLYCSSILPNKFLSLKRDQEVFKKVLCHDPRKPQQRRFRNIDRIYS